MWQRIACAGLLVLLAGAAEADCEKRTPHARLVERVQLAAPGETVTNEFFLRNTDSPECAATCFILAPGWRPPHDGTTATLRVTRPRLRTYDGNRSLPWACLIPGAEVFGQYRLTVDAVQDGPGYVSPGVFVAREDAVWEAPDVYVDTYDAEGGALCLALPYADCKTKAYLPQPPSP
jgi:hypothetical protein